MSPASKRNNGEVKRFSLFLPNVFGSTVRVQTASLIKNISQVDDNEGDMAVNIDSMGAVFSILSTFRAGYSF